MANPFVKGKFKEKEEINPSGLKSQRRKTPEEGLKEGRKTIQ